MFWNEWYRQTGYDRLREAGYDKVAAETDEQRWEAGGRPEAGRMRQGN